MNRLQTVRVCGTKNAELHTSRPEMVPVLAWYSEKVCESTPQLPFCLLAGTALRKRICSGRVHNDTRAIPGADRWWMSGRPHVPPRCAAIPGCRRFRSGHKASPETESGVREISLRKIRNATAERRKWQTDSQGLSGAGTAGNSNCGTLDKRVESPEFSIPLIGRDLETREKADSRLGKIQ